MDLELEEYEMLLDALDALGSRQASSDLMGMLLGGMLSPDQDTRDEFMAKEQAAMKAKEQENRLFKERIVLVKAKLIMLKDKATVRRETA